MKDLDSIVSIKILHQWLKMSGRVKKDLYDSIHIRLAYEKYGVMLGILVSLISTLQLSCHLQYPFRASGYHHSGTKAACVREYRSIQRM